MQAELVELREKPHSIELSRTSKGDYSWKIKLYFEDILRDADSILNEISRIDAVLKAQHGGK